MKKIWAFTTVKNEEDIIESFIRYNFNIVDGMVISINCSDDDTPLIIEKLKDEGYNIDILVDDNAYWDQFVKRNELLKYTIEKHNPDFIVPLDADEFIASYDKNPRDYILNLDPNYVYLYQMRNYIINGKENNSNFIPTKMEYTRILKNNTSDCYKCIIPKEIYKDNDIVLQMGAHNIVYEGTSENIESKTIEDDIFLAHYAVRSKEQLMNKVITSRINTMSLYSRESGLGYHQYHVFDEIEKNSTLSDETFYKMVLTYGIVDESKVQEVKHNPINTEFCKNITMKYTKPVKDNVLGNTLKVSEAVIVHMREKNESLQREVWRITDEYNQIVNSKRWKILNKIMRLFHK